ncbi:alpha-amylase family glycosyl hydrolase [Paenibacillus sp. SI8]|uniref:alpha-amylase family glycosyl hydrolase n=1 Tax=unclassified Paenibacillus TaxID=185978 RepID=UPI0034677F99
MVNSRSIYQIVTDRFYNGDHDLIPTDDLISEDGSHLHKYLGGNWEGIIQKIKDGYLTELGIQALLISQPVENVYRCLDDEHGTTSYHGYWPRDFLRPNRFFGSLEKFDELIQVAHAHHLNVYIDFTPNHTSPALETKPNYVENGVLYHDGKWISSYSRDVERIFLHNGGTDFLSYENSLYRNLYDLASFDHMNPAIDRILREGIQFWLDRGVDGIRMDAAKHVPPGWLKSFAGFIYGIKPVFIFGEWFLLEHESCKTNADFANTSGMSLLNFTICHALRNMLHGNAEFGQFIDRLEESKEHYKWSQDQVIFLDNHDMGRLTKEHANTRRTDIALALLLTSEGIPLIYYGTEQYMTGEVDPDNRKLMSSFDRTTTAYQVISKLNHLRSDNRAATYGNTNILFSSGKVIVYERKQASDVLLVMVNLGESKAECEPWRSALPQGHYYSVLQEQFDSESIRVDSCGNVCAVSLPPLTVSVYSYTSCQAAPSIFGFMPRMTVPDQLLIIQGHGLGNVPGKLEISGQPAEIVSWHADRIEVKSPHLAPGYHPLQAITFDGQSSNKLTDLEVLTDVPVTVRFVVRHAMTDYGMDIYLSGNLFELGEWNPDRGIGPFFNKVVYLYPTWYYDVSVPSGHQVAFKFFKKDRISNVIWEGGDVHCFTAPESGTSEIIVDWQESIVDVPRGECEYGRIIG